MANDAVPPFFPAHQTIEIQAGDRAPVEMMCSDGKRRLAVVLILSGPEDGTQTAQSFFPSPDDPNRLVPVTAFGPDGRPVLETTKNTAEQEARGKMWTDFITRREEIVTEVIQAWRTLRPTLNDENSITRPEEYLRVCLDVLSATRNPDRPEVYIPPPAESDHQPGDQGDATA